MNEQEFLTKIAEDYCSQGYAVITHPDKDHLPGGLGDLGVDLLAQRGDETVAVRLRSRSQLYDLNGLHPLSEGPKLPPGWRLDLIVLPPEGGVEIPRDGAEVGPEYITSLAEEAHRVLAAGAMRAAFVLAWAATEAAMREAARRDGVAIDREVPRFILKTLYSNGLISREDYDRVDQCFHTRNAVVHGFAPAKLQAQDIEFLLDLAERLLSQEPTRADS
jgi:hypothetical protein